MHEIVPRQGQYQKHASCRETSGFLVCTVLGRQQVDGCPSTPWMSSHLWSEKLPSPDVKSSFWIILCWLTVALTRGPTQKWSKRGKYFGIPLCEKANVVGFKLVCLYIPDAVWVYRVTQTLVKANFSEKNVHFEIHTQIERGGRRREGGSEIEREGGRAHYQLLFSEGLRNILT